MKLLERILVSGLVALFTVIGFAILVVVFAGLVGRFSHADWREDASLRQRARPVEDWFIRDGLAQYLKDKDMDELIDGLEATGFRAYPVTPRIDEPDFIAAAYIEELHRASYVRIYTRVITDKVYEYWLISERTTSLKVDYEELFLITRASNLTEPREIVYMSRQFFPEYVTRSGTKIEFPWRNAGEVYELKPWRNPLAYRGTPLEGVFIIDRDGELEIAKDMDLWEANLRSRRDPPAPYVY